MSSKELHIATKVLHSGNKPCPLTGAVIPAIYQTSTYAQESPGKHLGYEYTRSHNPTRTRLEECLADLEHCKYALTTSSGLAATSLIMHALKKGSKVLCGDDVYGGTYRIFTTIFNKLHDFKFINTTDYAKLEQTIKTDKPDVIWLESPTNPLLKITDIKRVVNIAHSNNVKVFVDNTFMSPYFQNPVLLGADLVTHSLTKYINGHSDVVGGSIMLNDNDFYKKLWILQNSMGPCASPFDSWLVLRGIKTLAVRMQRHQENALAIASFLENHSSVTKVIYPGLKTHPQHDIANSQMHGFGGMITFFIKGNLSNAESFLKNLKLFTLAESLGGVESLVEHPAIMTHAAVPKDVREKIGISDTLIRLSVGIEDQDDLIQDLDQALTLN